MKILHVIASADPRSGGPVEGILQQNCAFGANVTSDLVTLDASDAAFLKDFPLTVFAMGTGIVGQRDRSILFRYGFSTAYIEWLRENAQKYDTVVVHGLWNFATMAAALVLPTIMKGGYYVYPHGMMDPWFAKHDPRKHFFKRISWVALEGRLLANARAVLFTAQEELDLAAGQFWGWPYRGTVIGYGISAPPSPTEGDAEEFQRAVPTLGEKKFLLFLSRIHPKKGCDLLVRAFAQIAASEDVDLVVAGPDEMKMVPELEALAAKLGVSDRIHWPGMLRGKAKWGAYRQAEAFILPSHQENFGIVVAEALACGVPVLTTDKVNIWREVENGRGGIIRGDTAEGVVDLLKTWFAMSDSERYQMSLAARRVFDRQFSVQYVARNFLNMLSEHRVSGAMEAARSISSDHFPTVRGGRGDDAA